MNAMNEKFNVKCLGIGENGFRYLTNSKHPVETPDDLHDLKLRIGGAPILVSTYESWGVDYTTAAWAEVYTGLQTKLYDGQENPIAVADASSIQEVQKYVTAWTANYGIEVYEMTPENAELFRAKIQPVYTKFAQYNELIDLLK